jgi:hypothetical protein
MTPLHAEEINNRWDEEERSKVQAVPSRPIELDDNSGHIKAALDRLDCSIADINGVANQLAHNIDPITIPIPDLGARSSDVPSEPTSEMEDFINRLTREANSIVEFLAEVNRSVRL